MTAFPAFTGEGIAYRRVEKLIHDHLDIPEPAGGNRVLFAFGYPFIAG